MASAMVVKLSVPFGDTVTVLLTRTPPSTNSARILPPLDNPLDVFKDPFFRTCRQIDQFLLILHFIIAVLLIYACICLTMIDPGGIRDDT